MKAIPLMKIIWQKKRGSKFKTDRCVLEIKSSSAICRVLGLPSGTVKVEEIEESDLFKEFVV